jgi:hypothetical protein
LLIHCIFNEGGELGHPTSGVVVAVQIMPRGKLLLLSLASAVLALPAPAAAQSAADFIAAAPSPSASG